MSALDAIYARIPDSGCRGLCVKSCGPILCSEHERGEIKRWSGVDIMGWISSPLIAPCAFLFDGRCSIYSMRPAICRLFGSVDHQLLRCPHGCKPGRPLTTAEAQAILGECDQLTSTSPPSDEAASK